MANQIKGVKYCNVLEATITSVDGVSESIKFAMPYFAYFEDIDKPFLHAEAWIVDSGKNLYGTLPIQGGEEVKIVFEDTLEEKYTYEFFVYKISGRKFTDKTQAYQLSLISKEAMYNEGVRINEPLSGYPNDIVTKILKEYLETDKAIFVEDSKYQVKFFPNGKKAHTIIQQLAPKSVPKTSSVPSSESTSNTESNKTKGKSSLPKDTKKASGSAGYFFFENYDGFHFKSVDYYFSDGTDSFGGQAPVETYTVKPVKDQMAAENRTIITEYSFKGEIDLFDQMRSGVFSTYLCFYNYSTGSYEEYTYNMADSFANQAHLGSQTSLGKFQKDLSQRPTRIVSTIIDHETWFSDQESGSNEDRDGGSGNNPFPDYQKFYMAQAFSRYQSIENQVLNIQIPVNLELKVGDKLKVMLPNMAAGDLRKDQPYDEENSGLYLISKLGHNVDINKSEAITMLELIRDTSGMKEYSSNVKS